MLHPDRLFHFLILGQTGTGKSTLLKNLIKQDTSAGVGFCLVDPHGDIANELQMASTGRAIYWDVSDRDCAYGYNPLTAVSAQFRPIVASGLIDTLKKQWSDAWGATALWYGRYNDGCKLALSPFRLTGFFW